MSRIIVTGRRWKKAASLYCALVLRPDLDAKGRKKLAQQILALGDDEAGMYRITDAEVTEIVWANSQCVKTQNGTCPLLIFGRQLSDALNAFFHGGENENIAGRGRQSPTRLAEEELE
ncbi:MAG: hypothetical protein DMG39_29520 [Acidobacteria bacterium]|nr:MAG: hypothetical protein DMG39_29520 [Acidobacteriota bacterium]